MRRRIITVERDWADRHRHRAYAVQGPARLRATVGEFAVAKQIRRLEALNVGPGCRTRDGG